MVDSLVIEVEEPLVIDDYSSQNGCFLMRGVESRKPYLIDKNGTVLKEYDILNEGENGIGANGALGYRFLDKGHWLAQGYYDGYHLFDMEGRKINKFPAVYKERYSMRVYTYRTTFHPYIKEGIPKMVGEESNSFDPDLFSPEEIGPAFYDSVKTIFNYNLQNGEIDWLETYPSGWKPKKTETYVGKSLPLVAFEEVQEELALLPTVGDQLFLYDFSGKDPVLEDTVILSHRYRRNVLEEYQGESVKDYPSFTDLRICKSFILAGFSTKIPQEVLAQLKSKDENFYRSAEFEIAKKQYVHPYYLLIKNGKQVGVIEKTAEFGTLDHLDADGSLYFNDNLKGKPQRNVNVFYQLKVKE
ncbi:hypothetical protein QWY93_05140 [Echinicola jeungdonensis]|uniref:WG containing repeat-containing protein n=1 Tax=Echinicola jeungdonensis TaxID=709343 RepID=A0ABV5J4N7_9BACT|nr:hypothetical protein [Echinicola jeungdonensis]MDN3668709.1 hypothetical protein [Echinicola jeungdonensis]